jgi:DNA adenine methylase
MTNSSYFGHKINNLHQVMKYLGGKQRLGKHLSPFLHQVWEKNALVGYMEPFCGSLGVLKTMTDIDSTILANDYHEDLIQLWKEVQQGTFNYPPSISEEEYMDAKHVQSPSAYKAFVGFGMSFGGRYFAAYSQKYLNGKKEDFCKEMVNSLTKTAPKIQKVEFTNQDYKSLNPNHMLVYCDPPYAYTKFPIKYRRDVKKYDEFDSEAFWSIMREWSKNNIVIISEMTAPPDFVEVWNLNRYRSAAQSTKTRFSTKSEKPSETHYVEKMFVHVSIIDKI